MIAPDLPNIIASETFIVLNLNQNINKFETVKIASNYLVEVGKSETTDPISVVDAILEIDM